jgi:hypothetical protein
MTLGELYDALERLDADRAREHVTLSRMEEARLLARIDALRGEIRARLDLGEQDAVRAGGQRPPAQQAPP